MRFPGLNLVLALLPQVVRSADWLEYEKAAFERLFYLGQASSGPKSLSDARDRPCYLAIRTFADISQGPWQCFLQCA